MGTMISVDTAVTLTDLSRRTLWRRIGGGHCRTAGLRHGQSIWLAGRIQKRV